MDSEQRNLSPARRSKRCVLNLLVFIAIALFAYFGLPVQNSDRSEKKVVVAASHSVLERAPLSADAVASKARNN